MSDGLNALGRGITDGFDALQGESLFGTASFMLALVFLFSGIPKLRKPELAALAMVDFGVATRARPSLGSALGIAELMLAAALGLAAVTTATASRVIPVAAAAAVLWAFAALIGRALRSPDRFNCFCFGSEEAAISSRTLIRTAALALLASLLTAAAFASMDAAGLRLELLELTTASAVLGTLVVLNRLPMTWGAFK
jgi:hypothetical protein